MPTPYEQVHYRKFAAAPFLQQGKIGESPRDWARKFNLPGISNLRFLPASSLDRIAVKQICQDPNRSVLLGYVCTMAWGGQGKGRGHSSIVENAWGARERISEYLKLLRSGTLGRSEAYNLFCGSGEIKYLGPSYFTKLIYFFTPAKNFYIMDQWTSKSVNLLTGKKIVRIYNQSPLRSNNGSNYQAYCDVVDHLAGELDQAGDHIEQRLMSKRGKDWRIHLKKKYRH